MKKELSGAELVSFIKPRQLKAVRGLRQAHGIQPKLAIVIANDDPVIDTYVRLKQAYAEDITAEVEVYRVAQEMVPELFDEIKKDDSIQGVILQLPLSNPEETDRLCALLPADKDIDALGPEGLYDSATPTAIRWLLTGHSIELMGKKIGIVGQGKLVGEPLGNQLHADGYEVSVYEEGDSLSDLAEKDIVIAATGQPELITNKQIKPGAVVIDAGTASSAGKLVGDVADEVRERNDISITPVVGGVGPLTIAVLFENLITACRRRL